MSDIYSTNINLKSKILDLKKTAQLLSEEQTLIENALNPTTPSVETPPNIVILNDEVEVEDIESTDDEINEIEMKQSVPNNNFETLNLQIDFEKYNIYRYENINNYNKPLTLFHTIENEIITQWNLLRQQYHKNMFEQLCKINDENNMQIIAYSILFDLMIAAHNFMCDQYKKNSNAINLILLNITELNDIDREKYEYLGIYVDDLINNVTKIVFERYDGCLNVSVNNQLQVYAIKCCEIIWNLIHLGSGYEIYPLEMYFECNDTKYDSNIHEKETSDCNDEIQFCVFPSLLKNGIYKSKIVVICNQQ
eukprot:277340_1